MSSESQQILASFDALPPAEQKIVAAAVADSQGARSP